MSEIMLGVAKGFEKFESSPRLLDVGIPHKRIGRVL